MHPRSRGVAAIATAIALAVLLSACTGAHAAGATIRIVAQQVTPFPPANSVWYSAATLRARQPFARWEQQRDRIEVVTWPLDCEHVPVAIVFEPGERSIRVETGRAPRDEGPRQCSAGQVLTSTFVGSRALRRDRPTTLLLDGRRVLLPPAPAMVAEPVERTVSAPGVAHPLRQVDGPLPQYSVRDSPWNLTARVSSRSTTISIGWTGGTCGSNASIAYVVETASTVTIDTALDPPPPRPVPAAGTWATVCAGVGIGLAATIRLRSPLGTRALLQHQYVHRPADEDAY